MITIASLTARRSAASGEPPHYSNRAESRGQWSRSSAAAAVGPLTGPPPARDGHPLHPSFLRMRSLTRHSAFS